jgi:hypothetical protein
MTFDRAVVIFSLAAIAGAIVVGQLDLVPAGTICWSVILLGRECAGCGLTRSFAAIGRGDIAAAVDANPLGPILFAWLVALVAIRLLKRFAPRFRYSSEVDAAFAAAVAVTMLTRLVLFYLG